MSPSTSLALAVAAFAAACTSALIGAPIRPNILLICVDDLRPELRSFGADYIHSPAMDALAASGRSFHRHFVQAPTCGASRHALLTGQYGAAPALRTNDALLVRAGLPPSLPRNLPRHFRENGYLTVALGKISHYPGGLGGKDWADPAKTEMPDSWDKNLMPTGPWLTPQRAMHGYSNGRPRVPRETPAYEHAEGDDLAYPDGWITREALDQMRQLAAQPAPFFLAVGILKPHLPFNAPKSYLDLYADVALPPIPHPQRPSGLSTWHQSGEFFGNYAHDGRDPRTDSPYADQLRKSYAAGVSYADAQVAQILALLDELNLADNTIVVLWGDHGFHLGEHAVWGKHTLFEESLRSPLIVRAPGLPASPGASHAVVETVDIYPTLCDLAGIEIPEGLHGRSLRPQLLDASAEGDVALATSGRAETIRTSRYRLIRHQPEDGAPVFELYDHESAAGETVNLAATLPAVVAELDALLQHHLSR